jgi:hypothetical protein
MRYLLLIYTSEELEASQDAMTAEFAAYDAFTNELRDRGIYQAGEALRPTSTATTVRVREGQTVTTDGPYVETKEALGGFYMVDATDLDDAIQLAAKIPGARHGSIEIRPIFDFDPSQGSASEAVGAAG